MLKNYFKTTIRSLRKNRVFSLINIFGLASGLTAAIFIFQYSFFELGFDRFHENNNELYRVINKRHEGDRLIQEGQITYSAVGPQMKTEFPEVIENCRTMNDNRSIIRRDGEVTVVGESLFADASFFTMFSFKLLAGDPETALKEFRSIVISEDVARRLFGYQGDDFGQFIGEMVQIGTDATLSKITGIMEDAPANSSIQVEMLQAYVTLMKFYEQADFSWNSSDFFHWIQLSPGADVDALQAKLADFSARHFKGEEVTGTFEEFYLQSVNDMHLNRNLQYEYIQTNDGTTVYMLIAVAIFILLMAWINYVNLTTSRSLERAKEVGLRKVIGAERKQLVFQFFAEALIMNIMAAILAITFVQLLQGSFNQLVEQDLSLLALASSQLMGIPVTVLFLVLLLAGTFASGVYPAVVLSSFRPISILKGNFKTSNSGNWLRKSLVVFQFAISSLLIAGTFTVYKQISFMQSQDLGMDIEQMLIVNGPELVNFDSTYIGKVRDFKNSLLQNPQILSASMSRNVPGDRLGRVFNTRVAGSDETFMLNHMSVDYGFVDQFKIEVLAGRSFEYRDHNTDGRLIDRLMLNETACKMLGFENPEAAINQKMELYGSMWTIIGVLKDFHQEALRKEIEPILFRPYYSPVDNLNLKLTGNDIPATLSFIKDQYDSFYPNHSFEYSFLDERFNRQYKNDRLFGRVFNLFSILVIIIASLGLFGLAAYNSLQRSKEIGVRKVLGASVKDIIGLLSKDFLLLILVANLVALPLVYLGAKSWLAGYAYAITPGVWLFAIPLSLVFIVAIATISVQTFKSARRNPIDSLRYE
ncbi:MAG: ABC transporter permease [Roseivirga sp.]